jgi:hypothetical protein
MKSDKCCIAACKHEGTIVYYNKILCDKHWDKLSKETPDKLKGILGIKK